MSLLNHEAEVLLNLLMLDFKDYVLDFVLELRRELPDLVLDGKPGFEEFDVLFVDVVYEFLLSTVHDVQILVHFIVVLS